MKAFRRRCLGLLGPFLFLVGPACQRPEEAPKPADLLGKDKMIGLLANLHMLEAQVESSHLRTDSARALYLSQQKVLLSKSGVTDSAFQRSYRYYAIHGKDLDDIYKAVIDTLTEREKKLDPATAGAGRPPSPPSPPPVK